MKKSVRLFWRLFFVFFGFVVLLLAMANFGVFGKMPSLEELENPSLMQASEVYAEDGTLMGKYYTERGNRSFVRYRDISKHVIDALISTEDERFYNHSGIDFKSTIRAIITLGREGGGSTITQQLAKVLLDQGSKNKAWRIIEKLKEWIVAIKLEKNFTKEEIITLYLNAVPFGDNVYGIRNAARTFFQKEPDRLNIEEAAVLIGMLKANYTYNPRRNPKAAMDRRNVVLSLMVKNGRLSKSKAEKLKKEPIKLNYKKLDENTGYAPYFRESLKSDIKELLKDKKKPNGKPYDIYNDGLKIYTTLNLKMQQYAEEAVAQQMSYLQSIVSSRADMRSGSIWRGREHILEKAMRESERWKNMTEDGMTDKEIKASFYVKTPMKVFAWNSKREKDTVMTPLDSIKYHLQMEQSGLLVIDPVTGEIKAWVGGIHYNTFKNDHVNLKTKRQVGSTIKPLLYTQAIEERGFTPETDCLNTAQFFPSYGWVPNSRLCGGGSLTMANALAYSKNCATAYIMKQVGTRQFADFLSRLNIPTKVPAYPSICLGTCDLSLYEMLWTYTIFAGRGFSTKPYAITRIEDRNGNIIVNYDNTAYRKEVISELTAYTMCRMMQGTVDKGTARGMRARVGAAEMGGKTGTTDDNADAWFIGYTPQLLAGAWVGFEYNFMRNTSDGNRIARPIVEIFFKKALNDKTLGLDKNARFVKPAEMENEVFSADIIVSDYDPIPSDIRGDHEEYEEKENYNDYIPIDSIGPESKPFEDPEQKSQKEKDTTQNDYMPLAILNTTTKNGWAKKIPL
ncbi:MAG: transglycosylase domain-containing protein [Chitinophagaceae bacterium]|nr:transglycosylase domain-containing protein [Chitinophagaceae bacterium]